MHFKNHTSGISLLACLLAALIIAASASAELAPSLEMLASQAMSTDNDTTVRVVVFVENQKTSGTINGIAQNPNMNRGQRIKAVINECRSSSSMVVDAVGEYLASIASGDVKRFWIVPAFAAEIPVNRLDDLAEYPGIRLVAEDAYLDYIKPVETKSAPALASSVSSQLELLNIPALWSQGLSGKGRLVCSFDTGVEGTHPALASKWRGNSAALSASWFSKVDPTNPPSDKIGHGTHTMGIMLGSTATDTFGVAPGAEWITAGVVDQGRTLSMTLADIIDAFQWTLNPDGDINTSNDVPDVILNSWGIPKGLFAPCDSTFKDVIATVEAAGIVTIFAAGNEGPDPMTIRSPADMAFSPIHTFSVGAIDNNRVVAEFSSRGPSSCDNTQIKPEVVAPGVNIVSSFKGGGYFTMSGSSMAAPYIAGLVALMREYNPDVTVSQIKNALIHAADDLGIQGDDNSYGYGLVDASKVLDYLWMPVLSDFIISSQQILGDGIAWPGQQSELQLVLSNYTANVETVIGTLIPKASGEVDVIENEAVFFFGYGGTTAISSPAFKINLGESFYNGEEILFELELRQPSGRAFAVLELTLKVGIVPPGKIASHITDQLCFSISDFGQYGFASGSIYNAAGEGFCFAGSPNLLYEAGIIVGRNATQLSGSVRDEYGRFATSDFVPMMSLSNGSFGGDGGIHRTASFNDSRSLVPVPIKIGQETVNFENSYDNSMVIFKYFLKNTAIETLHDLSFGFLADFDLPNGNEHIAYNEALNLVYQYTDSGSVVGLVGLANISAVTALANHLPDSTEGKLGLTRQDEYDLISAQGINIDSTIGGDMMFVVATAPVTLATNDSVEISFALVAAHNVERLFEKAALAQQKFDMLTSVMDDTTPALPGAFELHQNYPNPFNPATRIAFTMAQADDVSLEVFDLLGRKVKTLFAGRLSAGTHEFEWDATTDSGGKVASGVYFYRLISQTAKQAKKMILLK